MRRQQSVSNQHLTLAHESPAAAVGRGLWPERERVQPWWSAHRRPSVAVRSLRASALVHEIEKQFPVGRKIAFFFVDARPDPCPVLEAIRAHVPPNQVTPRARATPQDDRDPGFARDDCEQPTRDETRHEKRGAARVLPWSAGAPLTDPGIDRPRSDSRRYWAEKSARS